MELSRLQPDRMFHIPRKSISQAKQHGIHTTQAQRQAIAEPLFLPNPSPIFKSPGVIDRAGTNLAKLNVDNFNIEILMYHRFLLDQTKTADFNHEILRWRLENELPLPPYCQVLQELKLDRGRFEQICYDIREVYDGPKKSSVSWLRAIGAISLKRVEERKIKDVASVLPAINEELRDLRIPLMFSLIVQSQERPVSLEILVTRTSV